MAIRRSSIVVGGVALALIAVAIAAMLMTNGGKDPVQSTIKEIAAGEQNATTTTTETRKLAEGQSEDSKTEFVDVKEQEKTDSTEKFIVHTFVLEPQTSKRIIFKTAPADLVALEGKVKVESASSVWLSMEREAGKYCYDCGERVIYGIWSPNYHGPISEEFYPIKLKPDAEQTLVIKNNKDVSQTVSLDLSITYSER